MTATNTRKITTLLGILLATSSAPATAEYGFVTAFGSFGSARGQFNEPRGIAVESGGRIVVADAANSRIQLCSESGTCSDFGSPGTLTGEFDKPREVDFDFYNDEIVIADRGNSRIQFCRTTGSCDSFGGSGAGLGQFESPRGVAVLSSSQYVVADTENNRIQVCTRQGSCSTFGNQGSSPGQFDGPAGLAVNSSGQIIVADRLNDRIQICTTNGSCTAFGSTGTAPGQFREPTGLAVDSQDRIIVADLLNHRVQVCTEQGNCIAFGGLGSANGKLNSPWGVGVDANDRIIVSDSGNSRIQIFAEIPAAEPVVIDSFTTSAHTVQAGTQVTLNWSVRNADTCSPSGGTGGWSGQSIDPAGGSASILIAAAGAYTFTLQCSGGGAVASKSISVTATEPPPAFLINAGMTDAWYDPVTSGQGFFIIVWKDIKAVFLAWFTYDVTLPDAGIETTIGHPSQRWYTAFGSYSGDTAVLDLELNSGGIFDSAAPFNQVNDGTITLKGISCEEMLLSYDITSAGVQGEIPLSRITDDNVDYCEGLANGEAAPAKKHTNFVMANSGQELLALDATAITPGFNDAWYNPEKQGGQGIFAIVFPIIKSVFMAWFTYDTKQPAEGIEYTIGHPSQRWYTAFGSYEGDIAVMDLELNSNGKFDSSAPFEQVIDGEVTLKSINCNEVLLTYDIFSANLQGEIPLKRIANDNAAYCASLETDAK